MNLDVFHDMIVNLRGAFKEAGADERGTWPDGFRIGVLRVHLDGNEPDVTLAPENTEDARRRPCAVVNLRQNQSDMAWALRSLKTQWKTDADRLRPHTE